MMNFTFDQIIAANDETRLGLYTTTAQRLGTTPQNVEKDFWVCWTLDALFNGLVDRPRIPILAPGLLASEFNLIMLNLASSTHNAHHAPCQSPVDNPARQASSNVL